MAGIDPLSNSLFLSANLNKAQEVKKQKEKSEIKKKRNIFSSMVEKNQEIENLTSQGLPAEIAGLSTEESIIFLKDNIDICAEQLENDFSAENFTKFRKSISQFMKFITKNNFEVINHKRPRKQIMVKGVFFSEKREIDPFYQVRVIDTKLDELANMILQNYGDKISMLSKVKDAIAIITASITNITSPMFKCFLRD